jgi:hypothetical protein
VSGRTSDLTRNGAALVLGYEAVALVSGGRLPTVTQLCVSHHWLAVATVFGLVTHLVTYAQEIVLPSDLDPD